MTKEKQKKNYSKRDVSDFTENKYRFQLFARFVVLKLILPLFYKIEYIGREKIPTDKKFIIAGNHISYFDPILAGEIANQPLAYMGKKELFDHPISAFIMDGLACFAVNREKLEVSTIKTALNIFKTERWSLGIFPQGGIRRNRKIENINKGFAAIAKQMKTDIIPLGISGCEENNWNPFKRKILKVIIGDSISYNQEVDAIFDEWGTKVAILTGYEYIKEETHAKEVTKEPV
ncbi:MAG: 1-acyl-sn-glycerol-3-phosphate acyltransferase [Cyanobacteria bacterium SIG29]|nr:1-acyl-sn-glycerol-3-phosphate acyltransferase [Cyanobacteria bacterium SIG29]